MKENQLEIVVHGDMFTRDSTGCRQIYKLYGAMT